MPKIIAFSGSPRKNGYTNTLIREILRGAESQGFDAKFYDLNTEGIRPCQGCNYCRTHDGCAVQDPLQPAYEEIHQAEAVILGSPIYFHEVTAQTKIWIDRMFSMIESKDGGFTPRHPGKRAITVYSQGYYDAAAYQNAIDSTNGILKGFGWNVVETLLCFGTSSPTFVLQPELLKRAYDAGQSLVKSSEPRKSINPMQLIPTDNDAISKLVKGSMPPLPVIGTAAIRATFDEKTLQQAVNARSATGVTDVILNPDAHYGYGAPIGCVMVSPSHIFLGPVGVDIKCSMSLLQFDLPAEEIKDRKIRRDLINAICDRTPTGMGFRTAPKGRNFGKALPRLAVIEGATKSVCEQLGIPFEWTQRCEDSVHFGHDKSSEALERRLDRILKEKYMSNFDEKMTQFGSYGGGNHFGECETVAVSDKAVADVFGLKDGHVAFLSHCGSRGFGNILATQQFKILQRKFKDWGTPYPGGDRDLVYAPVGSHEANDYLDDMALGANFATVNHLLINALVLEAFREVFPDVKANFVYFISHNIVRRENWHDKSVLVHRKGATRAFPAGHHALKGTPFETTGHPILLPGNPCGGSAVMVGLPGAELTAYSINHGAGRVMGRRNAAKTLDQQTVDKEFEDDDILTNCRRYPLDEAPAAYKNFDDVLQSVKQAGLAAEVARLHATFVIKDGDQADD